ncbi:MAG: zinc ribbon domain-containing protein [Candidatus Cloacimonetes bacterium]|nr:zinc ribbon domain-containing protein [Candidatus Cloacimonadota bacterium]MBS3766532.1 zinc ribbon domain-containing protein [Candidatus Cloacimonadota bacterium]
MKKKINYKCPKCGNTQCEIGQMRVISGFWSKIFDVQGKKYSTVTCTRCKYTEIYQASTSTMENIFDLITN